MSDDPTSFANLIGAAASELDRQFLQFQWHAMAELRQRIIRNADETFGKTPFDSRASKAREGGRSGDLRKSILGPLAVGRSVEIIARGPGQRYVLVQEDGMEIRPKTREWLAIPAHPKYATKPPSASGKKWQFVYMNPAIRAMMSQFGHPHPTGAALVEAGKDKRNPAFQDVGYLLAKRVRIPPRKYIAPAALSIENDREWLQTTANTVFAPNFEVKVQ